MFSGKIEKSSKDKAEILDSLEISEIPETFDELIQQIVQLQGCTKTEADEIVFRLAINTLKISTSSKFWVAKEKKFKVAKLSHLEFPLNSAVKTMFADKAAKQTLKTINDFETLISSGKMTKEQMQNMLDSID